MKLITYTLTAALVLGSMLSANAQREEKVVTPIKSELKAGTPTTDKVVVTTTAQPTEEKKAEEVKEGISFPVTEHNFGNVKQADVSVTYNFEYTNNGKEPLVLTNVVASCGCTTPEYSKEPLAPGKTGIIKVSYGTKGRPGAFDKNITVYSTGGNQRLKIRGVVD